MDPVGRLKQKELARLIPVGSEKALERRGVSTLLACLSVIKDLAEGLFSSVGQQIGVRNQIECYTEVVFKGEVLRPDGLIILRKGERTWSALIEAKIGNKELELDQIKEYIRIAKENSIDAIITISNQLCVLPTHHPLKISTKLRSKIGIYHWSWIFITSSAALKLEVEDDIDPEQKYMLEEMLRYFRHESSGVKDFDSMNPEWREVCQKIKRGEQLNQTLEIEDTLGAWEQAQKSASLLLTGELGVPVVIRIPRVHRNDPEAKLEAGKSDLTKNTLAATFRIPDAASDLFLKADMARGTVSCGMKLDAPADKKRAEARINWLLRQLQWSQISDEVYIKANFIGRAPPSLQKAIDLRENPSLFRRDNKLVPISFEISLIRDLGSDFSSRKKFLVHLNQVILDFYKSVGEHLKVWVPPAPKIHEKASEESGVLENQREADVADPITSASASDGDNA